jgi:hypothetical protein
MADANLQRYIQLEAMELGLDPALALSLAHQESRFNPRATSPTGVQGLFQVTQETGRAYGQDPRARTNPVESTEAGLRYFKDLLTKRQGNVRAALMDYNGGSDPDFDRNVLRHYAQYAGKDHPAMATPRQPTPRAQPQVDRRAIEERIKALEALEAQPPRQQTQPALPGQAPLASGVPKEGYLGVQDLGGGRTATVLGRTVTDPRLNQGRPTNIPLIVPGIAREEIQAVANGADPTPEAEERAIQHALARVKRGETIPSYDTIDKAVAASKAESSQRGPSPSAPLDAPLQQVSPEEAEALARRSQWTLDIAKPSVPQEEIHRRIDAGVDQIAEEQRSASGIIPPIVGGVLGAVGGSVIGMPVAGGIVGGALGERVGKWMGTSAPEEPMVETPVANLYPSDVTGAMGALVPGVLGLGKAAARGAISLTRAGRALSKAEQTTAQQAADYLDQYQRAQAKAQTQAADQTAAQAEAWRTGEAKKAGAYVMQGQRATQAQALREQRAMDRFTQQEGQKSKQWAERTAHAQEEASVKTQQDYEAWQVRQAQRTADHAQAVAEAERQAEDAWQAVEAATEAGNQAALREAQATATLLQKQYRQALEGFETQNAQHTAAAARLQRLPHRYMPALPGKEAAAAPTARKTARASDVLYQRLDDVAGDAPVDVALGRHVAESMREEVLSHMPSMQDTLFRRVVTDLVESEGDWSVAHVHKALKDLGSYTRGSDPDRKYLAGQLSKGLQDALEASAGKYPETGKARDILLEANRTWRTEHGVDEIAEALRTGGAMVKKDAQGQLVVNLKALQNLPDVLAKKKKSFLATGALDETTWQQFVEDIASFRGTPARPSQRPPLPGSVPVKQAVPVRPTPKAVPELVYEDAPVPTSARAIPPPRPGTPPGPGTPRVVPLPTGAPPPQPVVPASIPFEPPAPVEPTITAPSLGRTARLATGGVATGVLTGPTAGMVVGLGAVGLDWAEFVLSRALLTGPSRKYLLANLGPHGEIDPRVLGALAGMLHIPGPEPQGGR